MSVTRYNDVFMNFSTTSTNERISLTRLASKSWFALVEEAVKELQETRTPQMGDVPTWLSPTWYKPLNSASLFLSPALSVPTFSL